MGVQEVFPVNVQSFGWPQWTWVALVTLGLFAKAKHHGKPVEYDPAMMIVATLAAITVLYYAGGFFEEWAWPQHLFLALAVFSLFLHTYMIGKSYTSNFYASVFSVAAWVIVLTHGGFLR